MKTSKGICLLGMVLGSTLLGGCATIQQYELSKTPPFYGKKTPQPTVEMLSTGYEYEKLQAVEKLFTSRQSLYDWARTRGHMGTRVMSATRNLDFNRQYVVVVSPGIQPHAGYTLSLVANEMDYGLAHGSLMLRINQPNPTQAYAQAVTAPFAVIQVPARTYKQIAIDYQACPIQQTAYPG